MSFRIPYRGSGIAFVKVQNDTVSVFMGKRSRFPFFGTWTVPGGSVETKLSETDSDGAKREFKEETNLILNWDNYEYIGCWEKRFPLFRWTTFFYITEEDFNNAVPNEFFTLKWVDIKMLKKYYRRPFTMQEINRMIILLNSYKDRR